LAVAAVVSCELPSLLAVSRRGYARCGPIRLLPLLRLPVWGALERPILFHKPRSPTLWGGWRLGAAPRPWAGHRGPPAAPPTRPRGHNICTSGRRSLSCL